MGAAGLCAGGWIKPYYLGSATAVMNLLWADEKRDVLRAWFETFAKAVDGYINDYNNERIQAKTKWMPPTKFKEASMRT